MKTKTFSLTLVLVLYTAFVTAQDYAFRVLVNKGKNEVKSGANWEPIKVGTSLRSPDELKVSENSYLGLIHVSGKPLEVKSAGSYKVVDLSAKVGKGSSVLNKYTDFILSSNSRKGGNMTATGAVHRGTGKINVYLPPSSSYIYGDTISIEWEKEKSISAPYIVTFTTVFEEELHKIETGENNVTVNLNDAKFANENDIRVIVTSKKDGKPSDAYVLRKYSRTDREKMTALYKELASQTTAKTAFNRFIRAGFFEQHKLLADAVTAFQQAVKMEPAYKEDYEDFLLRNGLKVPPKK
jgi:hypothetical protein